MPLWFRRVVVSGVLCTASAAFAQSPCSYVRLDERGGPLEGVPVTDNSVGLCQYAAAADLIAAEVHRSTNGAKRLPNISPESLAAFVSSKLDGRLATPWLGHLILNSASQSGFCTTQDVQNSIRPTGGTLCREAGHIAAAMGILNGRTVSQKTCRYETAKDENFRVRDAIGAASDSPADIAAVFRHCRTDLLPYRLPEGETVSGYRFARADRFSALKSVIDRQLDARRPVAWRGCTDVLFDRTSKGVDPEDGKAGGEFCKTMHAMTFIGRRESAGVCEYLMKNNWSADCKAQPYDSSFACEGGRIWVPEADLLRNTTGVFFFRPQ